MDSGKTKKIVVVVSGLDEEYQYNIFRGINTFAYAHNMNISYVAGFGGMVGSTTFDLGESSIYNLIDYTQFDGALLMTNTFGDTEMRYRIFSRVLAAKIPAVVFESRENPEFYDISIDNFGVMKTLVNHIIQHHGAKVINYVSGPLGNPEGKARYDAFISAMEENGLTVDEKRVFYGDFKSYDGKLAVDEFAASGLELPDAFICANDSMALTVASSLDKLGYKVPDEVMVTGFDNTFSARNSTPSITSVKRPLYLAGEKAAQMIYNVIEGLPQERSVILDAEPSYSESCGCKNDSNDDLREYKKLTYRKSEDTNNNIHMINRLTAGLAEATQPSEFFSVISSLIGELDCEKFSLCLCEDWQEAFPTASSALVQNTYSEYMTAPLIWDKGKRRSVSYFPSRNMFPEGFEQRGCVNYFLPLHFSERCLGYYIFTNSEFPTYSLLCHTLSMVLSNSLENIRKLTHLNKAMDELNRLYVIDQLCNIYNRNGFINIADDMFKECIAKGSQIMISFIDMDGLKFINDNYGHNEGDFAIQRIASIIHNCCEKDCICARFGGDEFVYFSPNATESDAATLARKINMALDNINKLLQKPYTISASIGSVVTVAKEGDTLYSIVKLADDKMYEVKKLKKNARKSERI
ncbi:GGDEF domain-containing protein [uncultured Ruminococcus sp.]|uniref:GGDEF domain-containing protein n=1 Tax=uncultured Ruminococcus sp. TaxID=165186 RepID=UPI0025F9B8CA|nr:GGDEF domain-containing protein [uncultured Ruminococcus sp.]